MVVSSLQPVYTIGIVSELIQVPPATIRGWEKHNIIKPQRKGNRRFYSDTDLKRLEFINSLVRQKLNIPAIIHYLKHYPCWQTCNCPSCMQCTSVATCAKPCWKEAEAYCQVNSSENTCLHCEFYNKPDQKEV